MEEQHNNLIQITIDCISEVIEALFNHNENSSGQWKLTNYSSICTGVKKTVEEEGDF